MAQWTTRQEKILETYANLGAEFIAAEIESETGVKRTVSSIQSKAQELGVSLIKYQVCPRCGARVRKLNRNTGLCDYCNIKELRDKAIREQAYLQALQKELEKDMKQTVEYQRVEHEYLAVSRSNQRLAKKLGLPPKRSRGTFWEREVLHIGLHIACSEA